MSTCQPFFPPSLEHSVSEGAENIISFPSMSTGGRTLCGRVFEEGAPSSVYPLACSLAPWNVPVAAFGYESLLTLEECNLSQTMIFQLQSMFVSVHVSGIIP